jgi:NAD(P)-dependent dehydrogenase (short-subunit alcohol dehydrogenase family)
MGKVWFVTGSSRGLGLSIVEAILNSGASVIATARKPQQLQHLVEKYGSNRVLTLALDVTQNDQAIEAVKAGHAKFGRIDVVVNNAGYADLAAVEDIMIDNFRAQAEANYFGPVYVTKAVLPILRQQGSGHIIQVSTIGDRMGTPGLSAYQSAKWGLAGFSHVLANEVGPLGIKVTVLEPGAMATDWAGSSMAIPAISQPYEATVGFWAKTLLNMEGVSVPAKVAEIVLKVPELEDPPVRLLVGKDTIQYAAQVGEALAASDKKWAELSASSS